MHEGMIRIKLTVIFLFIQCTNIFALNVLSDTLVIPFEHKQSAIVHKNTLAALDSVVIILKRNNDITLSIEGYAYVDEGNDTICKYLSLNRALFVRDCIIGRGIDSSRISFIKAMGQWKPEKKGKYKVNNDVHSRVELMLIYPPSPEKILVPDADEDGIPDSEDGCPDKYGYKENNGCPLKDVIVVPFNTAHAYITSDAYPVMDKLLVLLHRCLRSRGADHGNQHHGGPARSAYAPFAPLYECGAERQRQLRADNLRARSGFAGESRRGQADSVRSG